MKPLPGQKELPLVINHKRCTILKECNVSYSASSDPENKAVWAGQGRALAKLFLKYDDKPTSEMWIEILRLSRELAK